MSIASIWARTSHALIFAGCAGAAWILLRLLWTRARNVHWKREALLLAAVVYLAAVTEIIALRLGYTHRTHGVQLLPLKTTIGEARLGLWPLVYHIVGNVIWFAPLGVLLRALKPELKWRRMVLVAAGFSAALELAQLALHSGVADIDDVLLNALGALAGFYVHRGFSRK